MITKKRVVIVGAGPAGLTAATTCIERGHLVHVIEQDSTYVGGISRTVQWKGFRFDIGGHRFFSKNRRIVEWWRRRLGSDFITVERQSRIFYGGRFYDYPLKPFQALWNLGPFKSLQCVLSYVKARLKPIRPERSFSDWVTNRFGKVLFDVFFQTYTEKVWGMPCGQISADWAAQRIKNLSLLNAITSALGFGASGVTTLIDRFEYPRLGPGMMWETTRNDILEAGGLVSMGMRVQRFEMVEQRVRAVIAVDELGSRHRIEAEEFIVSMPMRDLVNAIIPAAPNAVLEAARSLRYRDFITIAVVLDRSNLFTDQWIYIHDPGVKVGRIQNFNNWSAEMVPYAGVTCLGLEYFCSEGDELWEMSDDALLELARADLATLKVTLDAQVLDGCVVRTPKAYPVYDDDYASAVRTIAEYVSTIDNLQVAGRNGMHRYNNQDHSMATGMIAAENIGAAIKSDPYGVNAEAIYHEESSTIPDGRMVPRRLAMTSSHPSKRARVATT